MSFSLAPKLYVSIFEVISMRWLANFGRIWLRSAKCSLNLAQFGADLTTCGQNWSTACQRWPTSVRSPAHFGPYVSGFGQMCSDILRADARASSISRDLETRARVFWFVPNLAVLAHWLRYRIARQPSRSVLASVRPWGIWFSSETRATVFLVSTMPRGAS